IRQKCNELVASFIERGSADIIKEFAVLYPDLVFAEIVGFPREKHPTLSGLLRRALQRDIVNLPKPYITDDGVRAGLELRETLKQIVEERRGEEPRDDLIGKLLAADVDGGSMPAEEIVGTVFFIFTA